jgi:diguanylate cyclase (GGDEF)-like protein
MATTTVVRAFMQYPHPVVLVDLEGNTLLSNAAWSERFGAASVVPLSVRALPATEGEHLVVVLPAEGQTAIHVSAWTVRMPDRVLLIFHGPLESRWRLEADKLRNRVSELEQLAATDHLTGAWNRAHFDRLIEVELARSNDWRRPVSLVLLDIDHFKAVNDSFGHGVGDSVLRELVRVVHPRLRPTDILFRWGGEEFAVLVSSGGYRGAERLADDLRRTVAAHTFRSAGAVTVSLGVAEHLGSEDPESWFVRLDEALYAAKHAGRNRVVVDRRGNSDLWAAESGASALHLVWLEAYECGDPTIDREHHQLFDMANELIDAITVAQADPIPAKLALDALLDSVRRHFADEELILAELRYADLSRIAWPMPACCGGPAT